jgi:hypothetical protein
VLLAWLPLLFLSLAQGLAWGDRVPLPFLRDMDVQVRLLIALPLLIFAERIVHGRMREVARQFVERDFVPDAAQTKLDSAIISAMRLRDSLTAEVVLIALVYIIGVGFIWRTQAAVDLTTWYGVPVDGRLAPSLAGWWFGCVSLPLMQFLLLRWYFRLFIWARFCGRCLVLAECDADASGSLRRAGFLATVKVMPSRRFWRPRARCAAGVMANRIFYLGAKLPDFKLDLFGLVCVMIFVVPAPPARARSETRGCAKRVGLRGVRHTGATLLGRVRSKMAAGRSACGRADHRQCGHPVARRPEQQLRSHQGNTIRAVHVAVRCATGSVHAFASTAIDADPLFSGRTHRTIAEGGVLTMLSGSLALSVSDACRRLRAYRPPTVAWDRFDYSTAIADSETADVAEHVKLRYMDLRCSWTGVDRGRYSLQTGVTVGAPSRAVAARQLRIAGRAGHHTDRPTITYVPMTGENTCGD